MSQADLLARLEAVTVRLERAAGRMGGGGGGGGDDDDDMPQYVTELQQIVSTHLPKVQKACDDLGLANCYDCLKRGYDNIVDFASRVPKSKKPTAAQMTEALKPAIKAIQDAEHIQKTSKDFKTFGDHHKAIYEAVAMCSWVTMAPPMSTPGTHIQSQTDACDFNLLRIQRSKKDDKNKAFVAAFKAFHKAMCEYGKQYFKKDGFVWNAKGGDITSVSGGGSAGAPTAKEESKEAPKSSGAPKKAGGGINAVFGELSKGLKVTSGLKKVKASQKTKNRKDRSGKVTTKAPVKKAGRKKGEPKISNRGGRWLVENHNEGVFEVPKADMKSNVYITMGDGATYNIQQKVKSITVDSCNKCRIFVGEVVSTVEMVNCKSVTLVVIKKAPSISIDKSQSPRVIIQKDAFTNPPDIYTSNISAMNIEIPGKTDDADPIEIPVPEQFVTKIDCKTRTISTGEVTHG